MIMKYYINRIVYYSIFIILFLLILILLKILETIMNIIFYFVTNNIENIQRKDIIYFF
jgi:hypothetical protein